jgi:hypothetical protein
MDIVVARYNPWFADTDILKTEAVEPGAVLRAPRFPSLCQYSVPFLDPVITGTVSLDQILVP